MVVDVIFNLLVKRVDAGKRVGDLDRGRTFFIALVISAAFQPLAINYLPDVDVK